MHVCKYVHPVHSGLEIHKIMQKKYQKNHGSIQICVVAYKLAALFFLKILPTVISYGRLKLWSLRHTSKWSSNPDLPFIYSSVESTQCCFTQSLSMLLVFFQFNDLLTSKDSKCDWPNLDWHIFLLLFRNLLDSKMKMYNINISIRIYFDMKKKIINGRIPMNKYILYYILIFLLIYMLENIWSPK